MLPKGIMCCHITLKKKILVFDPWAAVWLPLCLTLCKVPAKMKLKWKLSVTEIMSWSLMLETDSLHSTHFLGSPCTDTLLLGSSSCFHQWPTFWALLVPHSHSTLCTQVVHEGLESGFLRRFWRPHDRIPNCGETVVKGWSLASGEQKTAREVDGTSLHVCSWRMLWGASFVLLAESYLLGLSAFLY